MTQTNRKTSTKGAYFWILSHDKEAAAKISFLPLTSLGIYIFFFSLGYGPVPWIMMSELFMPEAKEKASAISGEQEKGLLFIGTTSTILKNTHGLLGLGL